MNEEDLKKKLTPEEYRVLREKGTEAPLSGKFLNEKTGRHIYVQGLRRGAVSFDSKA